MFDVDMLLTGERFRGIIKDLSTGNYDSIKLLIDEFAEYAEDEYSDAFVHKMQTICRFLIDLEGYEYVGHILELSNILGTYESEAHEGEECVISYAIRKIDDEEKIVRLLENCEGGDLTVYFYEYENPAMLAIDLKKYRVLQLVFEKKLCNEERGYGRWTALQYAAHNRKYELAELLLSKLHHDPNLYSIIDMPPIALAADANDFKMVELLIKYGADVSATDGDGRTAINYCRSDKMIEIFNSNGAIRENLQMRSISRIISEIKNKGFAKDDSIQTLIGYEKPMFSNKEDNIILLAARYGDVETFKKLAPFFNHTSPDDIIYSLFDWYELDGITHRKDVDKLIDLTNILVEAGVKRKSSGTMLSPYHTLSMRPEMFLVTTQEKAFALFNNIEKLGYRLDESDCLGCNRFHDAIENLNISLIDYCLSKGMKYKELDTEKVSAIGLLLGASTRREFKEANIPLLEKEFKKLLLNGCNLDHQDEFGNTPLHKLVNTRIFREYPIKLLLKNGANVSLRNFMDETPYHIGLRKNIPEDILELLKPKEKRI